MATKVFYLDSSIALRMILADSQRNQLIEWMSSQEPEFVSSRLLRTEVLRVLRRDGIPITAARPLLDRVGLMEISEAVWSLAEAIPNHIRTLDALHVATALSLGTATTVVSHDKQMLSVAHAQGLPTLDPVNTLQ